MSPNPFVDAMSRFIQPLKTKVSLMIGRAVIHAMSQNSNLQVAQITALADETLSNIPVFQQFGFVSVPPDGSEAITVSVGGSRDGLVIVATDNRAARPKDLLPGESAIFTDDGTIIKLKQSGTIEMTASTKVKITTPQLEVDGDIVATGNVTGGGTDMATVKSTYNIHTHPETGTETGVPDQLL